jgi:hypothetical protein
MIQFVELRLNRVTGVIDEYTDNTPNILTKTEPYYILNATPIVICNPLPEQRSKPEEWAGLILINTTGNKIATVCLSSGTTDALAPYNKFVGRYLSNAFELSIDDGRIKQYCFNPDKKYPPFVEAISSSSFFSNLLEAIDLHTPVCPSLIYPFIQDRDNIIKEGLFQIDNHPFYNNSFIADYRDNRIKVTDNSLFNSYAKHKQIYDMAFRFRM